MLSAWSLERPGWWRFLGIALVLLLALAPSVPLLSSAVLGEGGTLSRPFVSALGNSAVVALVVGALSVLLGLPGGVLLALYDFRCRRLFLPLLCLPLLVPSFLWSLGWSMLSGRLGRIGDAVDSSPFAACALAFLGAATALTTLASYGATLAVSRSQLEAARLAGGERLVFFHSCRNASVVVLVVGALTGVLTLSDPGPGQVFGLRTAAAEVLVSFAAQNDFALVAKQSLLLAFVVLVAATPLAVFAAPRLASQVLARQSSGLARTKHRRIGLLATGLLASITLFTTLAPSAGLALPLLRNTEFVRAWSDVHRTAANTLLYATGSAVVAVALGFTVAFCVGRAPRRRLVVFALLLAVFSLPPALGALGTLRASSAAPAWLDPFLRSRFTVCALLGVRFLPVAAFVGIRAWGTTSASWTAQAALSGVSLAKYLRKVLLPLMAPAAALAFLLVSLAATAEVGTVLLLSPPGEATLPLAIFTVMANAPEAHVASLCVLYLVAASLVLTIAFQAVSWTSQTTRPRRG